MRQFYLLGVAFGWSIACLSAADRVVYDGTEGPGVGKHIVLVSGDEEYRSEEALPQLGRILAVHHGFRCTVLFAMTGGMIDPNNTHNIPGLETLRSADLMIISTRFRDLPDDQMKHIDEYLRRGGPVLGLRTATHAFQIPGDKPYAHYGNGYQGPRRLWEDGFGRVVLGEKWINHHGEHGRQATRGVIAEGAASHPVVRGCEDIFGPTDVYGVRIPLPDGSLPLVLGAVLQGMAPSDPPLVGEKNDPMMPVAWVRSYRIDGGERGRVFTTTMGAASDLLSEGLRRLIVNAAYWCVGLEDRIAARATVDLVGRFEPSYFGFKEDGYWKQKNLRPEDFQ